MGSSKLGLIAVSCGLILLGVFISQGLRKFSGDSRYVTVKGLSEMEVEADKVMWPLVYKEISDDLQALYTALNRKNEAVVDFLISKGISRDDIEVGAPQIIDLLAEQWGNQNITKRYNATSIIIVNSKEVAKVREIIEQQTELLKQGIAIVRGDYTYRIQYSFTGLNDIKPDMIQRATANAREAAEKFAEDSGSKLGKIKRASQGQFSIFDRDAYTPHIKQVRVVTTIDYFLED